MTKIQKSDAEWRQSLSPEAYRVLREHGTERAGTSPLNHEKRKGVFACAGCGKPLFDAATKYESGTAPKSIAPIAAGTWAMSSPTGRSPRGCATA